MSQVEEEVREPVYGRLLVWTMRLLAILWFAKGLIHWALVIGLSDGGEARFELLPTVTQSATVFFAVVDLVAAVGLWMAAPWGGVIWLVAAVSFAVLNVTMPEVLGFQVAFVAAIGALVVAYLMVTYMAAREGPTES